MIQTIVVGIGLLIAFIVVGLMSYTAGLNQSTDSVRAAKRDVDKAMTTCLEFSNSLTREKLKSHRLAVQLIMLGHKPDKQVPQ